MQAGENAVQLWVVGAYWIFADAIEECDLRLEAALGGGLKEDGCVNLWRLCRLVNRILHP